MGLWAHWKLATSVTLVTVGTIAGNGVAECLCLPVDLTNNFGEG